MPIVRIDIQAGKSTAYKRDILRSVRSAIVVALGVPDDRVMQRVIETPAENIDATETRSDRLTIIDISMLPGRDADLKQALYSAIVEALGASPGIHQRDITVIVNDPAAECFAIGGIMQCTLSGAAAEDDDEMTSVVEVPVLVEVPDAPEAPSDPPAPAAPIAEEPEA